MSDTDLLEAEINSILEERAVLLDRLHDAQKRLHMLQFPHPVGTVFITRQLIGFGSNRIERIVRWKLTRFSHYGPHFQIIKRNGELGKRFGSKWDLQTIISTEPPAEHP